MRDGRSGDTLNFALAISQPTLPKSRVLLQSPTAPAPSRREPFVRKATNGWPRGTFQKILSTSIRCLLFSHRLTSTEPPVKRVVFGFQEKRPLLQKGSLFSFFFTVRKIHFKGSFWLIFLGCRSDRPDNLRKHYNILPM